MINALPTEVPKTPEQGKQKDNANANPSDSTATTPNDGSTEPIHSQQRLVAFVQIIAIAGLITYSVMFLRSRNVKKPILFVWLLVCILISFYVGSEYLRFW